MWNFCSSFYQELCLSPKASNIADLQLDILRSSGKELTLETLAKM